MYLPNYTSSRSRKKSPCSPLWKSQFCLGLFVYTVNLKSTFMPKMWENERWIKQDGAVPGTKELEMCHDSFFPLPLNWAWRHYSANLQALLSSCTANEASCVLEISNWKHFASTFCPMISYPSSCQLKHFSRDCRPASSLQTAVSGTSYKTQESKRKTGYQMTQLKRHTLTGNKTVLFILSYVTRSA